MYQFSIGKYTKNFYIKQNYNEEIFFDSRFFEYLWSIRYNSMYFYFVNGGRVS